MKIQIYRGISGSGKTTAAKVLEQKKHYHIVSRDDLRLKYLQSPENLVKYFEGGMDYIFENFITEEFNKELARHICKGHNIVIDNTNLKKRYVQDYVEIFADLNVSPEDVEIVNFDEDYEVCLERVKKRTEKPVSEEVLKRQYEQYKSARYLGMSEFIDQNAHKWITKRPRRNWYYTNFDIEPYKNNYALPFAFIFDIDGTIAHRNMRLDQIPHVLRSYYGEFDCSDDQADFILNNLIHYLQLDPLTGKTSPFTIIFVSGREESNEEQTFKFLDKLNGGYDYDYRLLMRKNGDDRDDATVKYEIFNKYIRNKYNVLGVFDDRKRVLAMWEELGLKTFNVGSLNDNF